MAMYALGRQGDRADHVPGHSKVSFIRRMARSVRFSATSGERDLNRDYEQNTFGFSGLILRDCFVLMYY
jgi:hypothetical protein